MKNLPDLFAGILFTTMGFCFLFLNEWVSKETTKFQSKLNSYLGSKLPFLSYLGKIEPSKWVNKLAFYLGGIFFLIVGIIMVSRFFK